MKDPIKEFDLYLAKKELSFKLGYIGFQLAGKKQSDSLLEFVDLEQTIIDACYSAWDDGRMLGVLFTWAQVHGQYLIAEKLGKVYAQNCKFRGESPLFMVSVHF